MCTPKKVSGEGLERREVLDHQLVPRVQRLKRLLIRRSPFVFIPAG